MNLPDGRVIEYVHDPMGRRIAKKINGMIIEKYLWQGLTRLLAVYDENNNLLMRLQYGEARMPVAMTRGTDTYYLSYDQVGSLRVVADALGNPLKRIEYDSFGSIINDTNPEFAIPFGFAGGLQDKDIGGLVKFGFRDYDPEVGRWTAKDPISFSGADVDLYGYVANNPISYIDPYGLLHEKFVIQLAKMADRSLKKTIKSLEKNIAKHEKALIDQCQKEARKHHEHELRLFREQLDLAQKEAAKRGLLAAGAVGTGLFAEDISEEEADKRTGGWILELLDPFGADYAY